MQWINKQFNKVVPVIERTIKWVVRTAFELLKLTGLAFTIMHLVSAALIIEAVLTGVAVFASLYFTKFWK
jgi:ABC-type proline/glycine betaine transport system permease subunit